MFEKRVREAALMAPGAIATGAVREMVSSRINPTWTNVPVAKSAYVVDGVGVVAGLALEALAGYSKTPSIAALAAGVWVPSLAYLAQNATHDARRKLMPADPAPVPVAPTQVFQAQPMAALPAPMAVMAVQQEWMPPPPPAPASIPAPLSEDF